MSLREFLSSPSEVARRVGPQERVVISSRVRLARNIKGYPFPGWAKKQDRINVMEKLLPAVESLPQMKDSFSAPIDHLSHLEKQLLVERHLISREHAEKGVGSAVVLSKGEVFSVMINEEDHLRMQAIRPGLQMKETYEDIDKLDTELEKSVEYAFHNQWGYLTACPTNVGTGIRASAMLHLPGLVLTEQINQIIQSVNKLGLAVRGLYGEGTEALGNVFQVSNQQTLGEEEIKIVDKIEKVVLQIIEHELNARELIMEKQPNIVMNHIGRAYGILANSYTMASKEAMNLLSLLKLGFDYNAFPGVDRTIADELFLIIQRAHLQLFSSDELEVEKRDVLRAKILRERLRSWGPPGFDSKQNG